MINMLYLVTNRSLVQNKDFYDVIEEAIYAGVHAVILREKDLEYDDLCNMGLKIKKMTKAKNIPLIVNGNIHVAKAIHADGFHIGYSSFKEEYLSFKGTLGISVHSVEEGICAQKLGADYILAGHIFPTSCKADLPPRGKNFIKNLREKIHIPIIAIGGINKDNFKEIYEVGGSGIAIMSGIMQSHDVYKTVKEF